MHKESAKRTILKTISWRVMATIFTFIAVWLFTGAIAISFAASLVTAILNSVAYYLHERLWNKVSWGRN